MPDGARNVSQHQFLDYNFASQNFASRWAFALSVGERRLRHVAVSWTALKQAAACRCLSICGIETEAQGRAENLNHLGVRPGRRFQ
jgi:hypothetical protein